MFCVISVADMLRFKFNYKKKKKTLNNTNTQHKCQHPHPARIKHIEHSRNKMRRSSRSGHVSSSFFFFFLSIYRLSTAGALQAVVSTHELLPCLLSTATGWSLIVLFTKGSSLSMRSLSGAGFVTMPIKRGTREASSTRANRKGELTENMEMERRLVTTVAADASTPSSLSSTVLAWRTLPTLRGWSEIPERSGPENREPRPGERAKPVSLTQLYSLVYAKVDRMFWCMCLLTHACQCFLELLAIL